MTLPQGFPDSPEHRLILLCARKELNEVQKNALYELLNQPMDWSYILRFSYTHGVILLLHRHLKTERKAIPEKIYTLLQNNARSAMMRNLKLLEELKDALRLLQDRGITALAYKGPAQAVTAYGSLELRSFQDLDIVVRPVDLNMARETLLSQEYRIDPDSISVPMRIPRSLHGFITIHHDESLQPVNGRGTIDLHREVSPAYFPFPITVDEVWRRKVVSGLNTDIYTLCPEDTLLSMAVHAGRHFWGRLEWICSFHEFLLAHGATLNWEEIKFLAEASGISRALGLAFHLANGLHRYNTESKDLALPSWAHSWAQEARICRISTRIWSQLAHTSVKDEENLVWSNFSYFCQVLDFKVNKWKIFRSYLKLLVAPGVSDIALVNLPPILFFLYFPIRVFRLAIKYKKNIYGNVV